MMMGMLGAHALVLPSPARFLTSPYRLETIHTVYLQGLFSQNKVTYSIKNVFWTFTGYRISTQTPIVSRWF